jgi:hypothetical protein
MNIQLIVCIILLSILLYYIVYPPKMYEGMTNDEAIQNIASLYNTGLASVSNIKVTENAAITGTVTTRNVTVSNDATVAGTLSVKGRSIIAELDAMAASGKDILAQIAAINTRLNGGDITVNSITLKKMKNLKDSNGSNISNYIWGAVNGCNSSCFTGRDQGHASF